MNEFNATRVLSNYHCDILIFFVGQKLQKISLGAPCSLLTSVAGECIWWRHYSIAKSDQRSSLSVFSFLVPINADNVALPAFACRFNCRPGSNRSISPAHRAHSSKPAAARLLLSAHAGTDRRTDEHRAVT